MEQITLFDVKEKLSVKASPITNLNTLFPKFDEKYNLVQMSIQNYNKFHGVYSLQFKKGINVVLPKNNGYDIDAELSMEEILDPAGQITAAEELYQKDLLNAFLVLRGDLDFEELSSYSFFPNDKYMDIEGVFLTEEYLSSNIEALQRKKKYRGAEWYNYYKSKEFKEDDIKFNRLNDKSEYLSKNSKLFSKIKIYPYDLPCTFSRFNAKGNFDFLFKKYPNIDIDQLVEDTNILLFKSMRHLRYCRTGEGDYTYILKGSTDDKLIELAFLISLEKQLNSPIVVLESSTLQYLLEYELEVAVSMLQEFVKNNQQVILFYNNVFCECLLEYIPIFCEDINRERILKDEKPCYNICNLTESYKSLEDWRNVSVKISARRLVSMQELSFDNKVKLAESIILKAYRTCGPKVPALGMSFGRDSMVLYYILKKVVEKHNLQKPILCFCDTKMEFPEHIKFAKEMVDRMEAEGFSVHWEKAKHNFWKIVEEYGFPIFSKSIRPKSHPVLYHRIKNLGIKYASNKCCQLLKKETYMNLYKKVGVDLVFTGLQADESNDRRQGFYRAYENNLKNNFNSEGEIYYVKSEGLFKCTPLIHFTKEDVKQYIDKYSVPTSPLYSMGYWKENSDGTEVFVTYERTGCWACAYGINFSNNNLELLRHTHPHLYELLVLKKNLGKELYKFKHGYSEDEWNKDPKYFDSLFENHLKVKPCHLDIVN